MKEKKNEWRKKKNGMKTRKKESSLGPTLKNGENVFCNCYCFLILWCHSWPGYSQVFMLWNIPSRLSFFFFFFFFPAIHVNLFLFLHLQTGRGYVAGSAVKLLSQATATSTQGWHTDGWRWRGAVRRPHPPCFCRRDLWTSFVFFCGETNRRESDGGTRVNTFSTLVYKKPRNSRAEKTEIQCVCVCLCV